MNKPRTIQPKRILALCAVLALLAVAAVSAYATDLGGVRTTLRSWLHGEMTDVSAVPLEDGGYEFRYSDDGGEHNFEGGGVAYENGKERPLSAEEVLDSNGVEVSVQENGRIMLYYYEQSHDITDLFDDEGVCRVKLKDANKRFFKTVYFDIELEKDDNVIYTCSCSTSSAPQPFKTYTALDG